MTKKIHQIQRPCIVGLGKLGSPFAAALASKELEVTGLDLPGPVLDKLAQGCAPVFEPGLQELLDQTSQRLQVTSIYPQAIAQSDAAFVIVPTPSDKDGGFSLKYLLPACESIGRAMADLDRYYHVVITSTVMPGATNGAIRQILESTSGKRAGADFGLCYSPEFIALGSVIDNFLNPDFVLIGESDTAAGDALADFYRRVCDNDPPLARMSLVNAEITKISLNSYVTTKITYANQLARICERIEGADADVVASALGLDSRIGKKYLRGAIGFGGPCFPRDNRALVHLAQIHGGDAPLASCVDHINDAQLGELIDLTCTGIPTGGTVAIAGLSYKPDTDVIEESHALRLAAALAERGYEVRVHDPRALDMAQKELGDRVQYAPSIEDCARACDAFVVATAWSDYVGLDPAILECGGRRPIVVDCWRVLDAKAWQRVSEYRALGSYIDRQRSHRDKQ